ncbi:MAG: pentapeptide repeat-containing protein [Candidatus Aenigmatarchaeota archaeon]|nr:pentapeptide repeat-containing protein [Candidatus Aenigmarchaeota archaeon]
MTEKIRMSGEEFIKKIMKGERDFRDVSIKGYNFDKDFELMLNLNLYFIENKQTEKINLENSDLSGIKAERISLWLPHLVARRSTFNRARIPYANLSYGIFVDVDFREVYAPFSNFEYTRMKRVDLSYSNMSKARFDGSTLDEVKAINCNFYKSSFYNANIKKLEGLDESNENYKRAFYYALRTTAKNAKRKDIFRSSNPQIILNNLSEIMSVEEDEKETIRNIIEEGIRNSFSRRMSVTMLDYFRECFKRSLDYRI